MMEKLNEYRFLDYLKRWGNDFSHLKRRKKIKDGKEYSGESFILCKPLTPEQEEFLKVNYANVVYSVFKSKRSPEWQECSIFLADKAVGGVHPDKVGSVIKIDSFEEVYDALGCVILKFKHFVQETGKYKGYHVCELYGSYDIGTTHHRYLVGRVIVSKVRNDIEPLCLSPLLQYIAFQTDSELVYNEGFMVEDGVIYDLQKDIFNAKSLLPSVREFSKVQELLQTMGYSLKYIGNGKYSLCKAQSAQYICKQNVCPNYESCMLKNRYRKWGTS